MHFAHVTLGQRVLFGSGNVSENVAAEISRLGGQRIMVIASETGRRSAQNALGGTDVELWWDQVVQHVPVEAAVAAREAAADHQIDVILCVGGGSATGLAKAVALATGIPIVAVPTTYSGSEATNVWGMTENRVKTTGVDDRVLPVAVVYDAELSKSLPVELSVASGLNSLAHCIDSLWAPKADPINEALALEGARSLNLALRGIIAEPENIVAREEALYGCYLAAVAFASAGSGLHHKICHVLGGTFELPHAATHATVLPYVLALNVAGVPELAVRLATSLTPRPLTRTEDPSALPPLGGAPVTVPESPVAAVEALNSLRRDLKAPSALAEVGFTEASIPGAVERVLAVVPASNPVPITEENLTRLFTDALAGAVPTRPYQSALPVTSLGPDRNIHRAPETEPLHR